MKQAELKKQENARKVQRLKIEKLALKNIEEFVHGRIGDSKYLFLHLVNQMMHYHAQALECWARLDEDFFDKKRIKQEEQQT